MSNKRGLLALSPLLLFITLYVGLSLAAGDFYKVPMTVVFLIASVYAIIISGGLPLQKRINTFSHGASSGNLLLMLWIYVLAGAFAASAKQMGAIDATVNMCLTYLPASMLLPGLFLAACFISLSIGTSVGTVVALVPIAVGIAQSADASVPLTTAVIVGGAYFGDNLSFISDTTIVATQTQGCSMSDKFRVNLLIVSPAVILVLAIYAVMGAGLSSPSHVPAVEWPKVVPYLVVLITAVCGMNVMAVLVLGIVMCGVIGLIDGSYDLFAWMTSMGEGIVSMGELIVIAMMAGGIAALVSLVNCCTANNTVAILTVGSIAKKIGDRFGVDNRKAASILDTFSCAIQGVIPYGVQMLLAAGLAEVSPMQILPYLYYPVAIGIASLAAILLRYPKKYS